MTMELVTRLISFMICLSSLKAATFDPSLRVISCTRNNLVVKVTGATDDGLIYIQGQGEDCKLATSVGKKFYEFDFAACDIEWEMTFHIIIQKVQSVQTGTDKQIPVVCIADTNDVVVGNLIGATDKGDDGGLNRTVRPDAHMSFFKVVTQEEVIASEVMLGDRLIMVLQLAQPFTNDFDIKARYCRAADLVLIDEFCAVEPGLFGNFWKMKQGNLLSEFGAFRTTDIDGGSVLMNFTCVLQLCQGPCIPEQCGSTYNGWGRRKRAVRQEVDRRTSGERSRRQTENDDINVGATIKVVDEHSKIKILSNDDFYWNKVSFIMLILAMCMCIIAPSGGCYYMYRKLVQSKEDLGNGVHSKHLSVADILSKI